MRVTNSMLVSTFMNNLNNNMNKLGKLQSQLQTNRKYASITDDPVSAIYSMQARFRLDRLERYQKGVEMSQNWLTHAENSVMEINDLYKNVYETVIGASTNVKTDADRANMAEYVKQLRDQLLTTLNTSFGNKYIFAGFDTTGSYPPPGGTLETPFRVDEATGDLYLNGFNLTTFVANYDDSYVTTLQPGDPGYDASKAKAADTVAKAAAAAGLAAAEAYATANGITFDPDYSVPSTDPAYDPLQGAAHQAYKDAKDTYIADFEAAYPDQLDQYNKMSGDMIQFWIGNGLTMDAQVNGLELVGTGDSNLYAMLDNLYKTLTDTSLPLENMVPKVQEFITPLQNKQSGLLALAADLGGRANRLEMMADRYENDFLTYTQMKSNAEDADEAELIMMYKMAEAVYKASLSTGASIIQQTLMDFLR